MPMGDYYEKDIEINIDVDAFGGDGSAIRGMRTENRKCQVHQC